MKSPRISFGAVSMSNGAVKTQLQRTEQIRRRPAQFLQRALQQLQVLVQRDHAFHRDTRSAAWLSWPTDSTASIRCFW